MEHKASRNCQVEKNKKRKEGRWVHNSAKTRKRQFNEYAEKSYQARVIRSWPEFSNDGALDQLCRK
jgi:hypothetical protein